MTLDIEIIKGQARLGTSSAWIRVSYSPAPISRHRDDPPEVDDIEVIEAWYGSDSAGDLKIVTQVFDAFGIDLLSLYETEIAEALKSEYDRQADGLAEMMAENA